MFARRCRAILTCVAASLLLAGAARAASQGPREYQVKAAFLYNFAQFVEWPAAAFADEHAPFVLGVVGQDPFGDALEQVARDKSVAGHPLQIKRFDAPDKIGPCHLLFVAASEQPRMTTILARLPGSVLTVGDYDGFTDAGVVIRFFLEEDRVRFEVNADPAESAHLKVSSRLLRLARIYHKT